MTQRQCIIQLYSSLLKIVVVHEVAALVVADIDAPGLRHLRGVDALVLVALKDVEETSARLEFVECELHLDNL